MDTSSGVRRPNEPARFLALQSARSVKAPVERDHVSKASRMALGAAVRAAGSLRKIVNTRRRPCHAMEGKRAGRRLITASRQKSRDD
jgi:hypothetical protein